MMNTDEIRERIWQDLSLAVSDKKHAYNTGILATTDLLGHPQQRTLVLRNVWQKEQEIAAYTDWRSEKTSNLIHNPHVCWLFYDPREKTQIRMKGTAKLYRQNELTCKVWKALTFQNRLAYLAEPGPGSITRSAGDGLDHLRDKPETDTEYGYANFCIIKTIVTNIDWLKLNRDGHVRVAYERTGNKRLANWLIP